MHGRDLARAVELAKQATRGSRDILSSEAHAWAAFRTGDLATARRQIDDALRTGSRLRRLRYHAAAIYARIGDRDVARAHLRVALASPTSLDLGEFADVAGLARDLGLAEPGTGPRVPNAGYVAAGLVRRAPVAAPMAGGTHQ